MALSLTSRNLPHFFSGKKTGSGKSGKNPDIKFRKFLIRFLLMYIRKSKFMKENRENLKFLPNWTFLT